MTASNAERHFEYVELGMRDPVAEARAGLGIGLKETFFERLVVPTLEWLMREDDADVRNHILDHIVRQSSRSPNYEAMALEIYEKENADSVLRRRMEAGAAGTYLYSKLRLIETDGSNDLFRGRTVVSNTTINISGGVQGGAVSLVGDASNSGATSNHYGTTIREKIATELSRAEREVHSAEMDADDKKDILEKIGAAKNDVNPDNVSAVVSALGRIGRTTSKAVELGTKLAPIISALGKAAGFDVGGT